MVPHISESRRIVDRLAREYKLRKSAMGVLLRMQKTVQQAVKSPVWLQWKFL